MTRADSDTEGHDLADALTGVPLIALYGGVAVYLLGHVGFRRRNTGTWNPHRSLAAAALLLLLPLAWQLPALAALAIVAAVLAALVSYEVRRFGPARDQVRHHRDAGSAYGGERQGIAAVAATSSRKRERDGLQPRS